jgi:DNA-binding IclR family transcriptional regulator
MVLWISPYFLHEERRRKMRPALKMDKLGGLEATASRAPAALRAAAVLKYLARSNAPQTLSQIAVALDLLPSSVLNILRDLVVSGLVERDDLTKQYAIGLEALSLAYRHLMQNRVARAAQAELDRLHATYGYTALLTQRYSVDRLICVAVSKGRDDSALPVRLGLSENGYASASGRIALAFEDLSDQELARIHASLSWHDAPPVGQWMREVRLARTEGYAIDVGRYRSGRTFIAAPVVADRGTLIAVLTIALPTIEFEALEGQAMIEDMKRVSRSISAAAGE